MSAASLMLQSHAYNSLQARVSSCLMTCGFSISSSILLPVVCFLVHYVMSSRPSCPHVQHFCSSPCLRCSIPPVLVVFPESFCAKNLPLSFSDSQRLVGESHVTAWFCLRRLNSGPSCEFSAASNFLNAGGKAPSAVMQFPVMSKVRKARPSS